ncbi:MAG: antitoxin Xre/MbcA/ParS toxin-binding domain-containing protein [Emticicia sp.]|nr:antitoxin Xre/MbcA/ParS toxin-binding domain-containing protein [Emticicia sp.]
MTAISKKPSNYTLLLQAYEGIDSKKMQELMLATQQNKNFFAEILHISPKTFDRYIKEGKKFNPTESEKILKLEQVYDWGKEVFGNVETFNEWIEIPAYGLDDRIPKSMMQTYGGLFLVEDELIRIAYGALA